MNKIKIMCFVGIITILGIIIRANADDNSGLTFYVPFDKNAVAEFAKGNPNPLPGSKPGKLVPGIIGKGILLDSKTLLEYATAKNYKNAKGTLEFCFKYVKPVTGKGQTYLFCEGGRKNVNTIFFQRLYEGFSFNRIIWSLYTGKYSCVRLANVNPKTLGEWHHCLLTWNKDKDTDMFVDGNQVMYGKKTRSYRRVSRPTSRQLGKSDTMTFGPRNLCKIARGNQTAAVVIDEIKIYDRMFSPAEAEKCYREYFPLTADIGSRVFVQGKKKSTKISLENPCKKPVSVDMKWELTDTTGTKILQRGNSGKVTVVPGKKITVEIPLLLNKPGEYLLRTIFADKTEAAKNFRICCCPVETGPEKVEFDPKLDLKLLKEFDCTKKYSLEEFCDDGMSKVVSSPLGKYRVTSDKTPWSRFAYHFFINNPQAQHLAVVEYPDDHEYEMEVMIDNRGNVLYQTLENGVIVGGHYPNSNKMKQFKLLFWPTSRECTIMAMGWPIGILGRHVDEKVSAAAIKSIKIYEVIGGLPAVKLENLPPKNLRRTVGTREEDATSSREFGANLINQTNDFEQIYRMLNRRIKYMKFLGQNLYGMTLVHYSGGFYPSFIMSKDIARQSMFPDYWIELSLYLCEKNGIKVNAGLCLLNNEKLKAMANQTKEEIIAGKDTPFNIKWDGTFFGRGALFAGPPDYNVIHPKVQEHFLSVVEDILNRYGDSPAFNGFDFWFWSTMSFWFGDLKSGYGDYTVKLFENETGIKVPGDVPDPMRFTKRYVFLARTSKDIRNKWIEWRCRKVKEFWMKIRDLVKKKDPKLIINLECWAVLTANFININNASVIWKPGKLDSIYKYYRKGGIDLNMFKNIPGFYLGNVIKPNFNPKLKYQFFRDYVFAPAYIKAFQNHGMNSVWLEQNRREFDCMHNATPMPDYWIPEGSKTRYGGQPPRKGGKTQNRGKAYHGHLEKSGAVMANGDFYLEFYANILAEWDVRQITDGGLTTTTLGAEDVVREFIRAYLTLPAEYFEVFDNMTDPVCVRQLNRKDGYYFYMVNRDFYPLEISLNFNRKNFSVTDLPNAKKLTVSDNVKVTLGPYRLMSFKAPKGTKLVSVKVVAPKDKVAWLKGRMDNIKKLLATVKTKKIELPKLIGQNLPWFEKSLDSAWREKHYAWLRKLLDSVWAKNLETLLSGKKSELMTFLQAKDYAKKYFSRKTRSFKAMKVNSIPPVGSDEWKKAQPITGFGQVFLYSPGKVFLAKKPFEKTVAYCVYDDKAIAFEFECFDKNINKVVDERIRDAADLVKIMLSPYKNGKPYFYYRIHYNNANFYNAKCAIKNVGSSRRKQLKYDVIFKKERDRWLARIVIPFSDLRLKKSPVKGDVWRFNLMRKIRKEGKFALRCTPDYLPPKDWGFHCPARYENLIFE